MYELSGRIGFSEGGADGRLHWHQLINYFQNTSTFHIEDMGIDFLDSKIGFYMLAWQLDIKRLPLVGEKVVTGTHIHEMRAIYGSRNYWMKSVAGELLVQAHMTGCFMDLAAQKLYKLTDEEAKKLPLAKKLDMDYLPRKIKLPPLTESFSPVLVSARHIDSYQHVNNAEYLAVASNYIPIDLNVSTIRIEYKKAAVVGEYLYPKGARVGDTYYLALADENENPYALLSFS